MHQPCAGAPSRMAPVGLLDEVTAIVNTFERRDSLDILIRSVKRLYPDLKIVVGDGSFDPYPRDDIEYVRLEPDIGAGGGRNALLQRVETPYFLQLDDDFEFTAETRIERLAEVVHEHGVDLCGGGGGAVLVADRRSKRRHCGRRRRRLGVGGRRLHPSGRLCASAGRRDASRAPQIYSGRRHIGPQPY